MGNRLAPNGVGDDAGTKGKRQAMSTIVEIHGREILDSRGNPTVEVEVILTSGAWAARRCPPARRPGSTRRWSCATATEALRRQGRAQGGRRTSNEIIGPALRGRGRADQVAIDRVLIELDGTPNKGKLGANAILGVSLAVARAAAADCCGLPLYRYLGGASRARPARAA